MNANDWRRIGTRIVGRYYNKPYKGIVEAARVMSGGDIQYTVRLLDMINMGTEEDHDWRSTILVQFERDAEKYQFIEESA